MESEALSRESREAHPDLPRSVKRVEIGDKVIYLVGTAHVSKQSVEDVRRTIELTSPETICVELCKARFQNIRNREQWKKTDIVKIVREGRAPLLLTSLIMTSFQKRIAAQLGVTPGAEMIEGIEQAEATGAELVLADRDIQVTLKRTWARLGLKDKLKMVMHLAAGLFVVEQVDKQMVEEIKKEENLADLLQMLADQFPLVKSTLIDERDTYLAEKLKRAEGKRVVAIVGAGHVPGILRELPEQRSLGPLRQIPKPSLVPQMIKWGIPALIVALFVYGFFKGGAEHSLGSVYIWILVNGALSALGAALAFGHPLTILSAFVAAPLTSLNPMIAAG